MPDSTDEDDLRIDYKNLPPTFHGVTYFWLLGLTLWVATADWRWVASVAVCAVAYVILQLIELKNVELLDVFEDDDEDSKD